jgi:hypothetical protein
VAMLVEYFSHTSVVARLDRATQYP